jgi:hypothetical protein
MCTILHRYADTITTMPEEKRKEKKKRIVQTVRDPETNPASRWSGTDGSTPRWKQKQRNRQRQRQRS